ncbi:MAG: cyclase family protein [Nanoarchaeota archaeon]
MAKILDISRPIREDMITWNGMPKPEFRDIKKIDSGDDVNNAWIGMDLHTGTHVDAPSHHLSGGETIDETDLSKLIGKALVLEIEGDIITKESIEEKSIPLGVKKILLKTRNSEMVEDAFNEKFVGLSKEGAEYLVKKGVQLIGIDYLSVESLSEAGKGAHGVLFSGKVVILENLNLKDANEGIYKLVVLPLNVEGYEAAPARAVLIDKEDGLESFG